MATFRLLNALYTAFDRLVAERGAVKVEHVGHDYLVTTPLLPLSHPAAGDPNADTDVRDENSEALVALAQQTRLA
jgi:hypothetical protein